MNPWFGILLVLLALSLLMLSCQFICKHFELNSELARKSIHMGMGIICACFPLLFTEFWPVLTLCILAIVGLSAIRIVPQLRQSIGSSLHGVKRFSLGELYFPLAVAIVWFISLNEPVFYCIAVLVLALADAVAALIGVKYGKIKYSTKDGHKSWEGSFSFFFVAFFCIYIPLTLYTNIGRSECLLIAALIAILVMIIEASSWSGLDNMLIPISVCILLNVYQSYSPAQMLGRLGIISLFSLLFYSFRKRSTLDDSSLLGASLFLYLAYVIGDWQWTLAPLMLFAVYLFLGPYKITKEEKVHNIHSLLSVIGPGLIWLILFYRYKDASFLIYYNCSFALELCLIFIAQWAWQHPQRKMIHIVITGNTLVSLLMILPFIFFNELFTLKVILVSISMTILGSLAFTLTQKEIRNCPLTTIRWIRQGLIGFIISLIPWKLGL